MLVGKSGVGKSTLINNILKLKGEAKAPEGTGAIQTQFETTRKAGTMAHPRQRTPIW